MIENLNALNRAFEIPRTCIPAGFCCHDDIARGGLPGYKLYVFVNCFSLAEAERRAIRAKARRAGKTALFIYARGVIDPGGTPKLRADNISGLTGMYIRERTLSHDPIADNRPQAYPPEAYREPREVYEKKYFDSGVNGFELDLIRGLTLMFSPGGEC